MEETEEVYVLTKDGKVAIIADDFEWLNMEMAKYSADEQDRIEITNHNLYRVKGKGD